MITVAAIIPVARVAGSLIGVLLSMGPVITAKGVSDVGVKKKGLRSLPQ
jgi:hypothetical protein